MPSLFLGWAFLKYITRLVFITKYITRLILSHILFYLILITYD